MLTAPTSLLSTVLGAGVMRVAARLVPVASKEPASGAATNLRLTDTENLSNI